MKRLLTTAALAIGLLAVLPQEAEAHPSRHSQQRGVTHVPGHAAHMDTHRWVWIPARWSHGRFRLGQWKWVALPPHGHRAHKVRYRRHRRYAQQRLQPQRYAHKAWHKKRRGHGHNGHKAWRKKRNKGDHGRKAWPRRPR